MIQRLSLIMIALLLPACASTQSKSDAPASKPISLFDGKTLGHWAVTQFGGQGEVHIEDGAIILPFGSMLTGITWNAPLPAKMNYEISLQARRVDGNDFFCGLTFPVGDDPCTLICGGWGGGVTGLSNLDNLDASENNTSQWIDYENGKWYNIRVRVRPDRIQAWIDDKQIINADIRHRKIGVRIEVDLSRPLGVASYATTAAVRDIQFRKLPPEK